MATASYGMNFAAGGISIQSSVTRTADSVIGVEATLPVGKAGTLTTRSSDTAGICTLGSGHGITDALLVDIYWTGGMRYGMTVSTYDATTITVTGGAGTVFPIATTALVATKQVQVNVAIDGDELEMIGLQLAYDSSASTAKGHATFKSAAPAVIKEMDFVANVGQIYDITGGATNVFTGAPITTVSATNGSATEVGTLKIAGVVDSTP